MPLYIYAEKQTEEQIANGDKPTVLALVDAPNPAKADKAFLADKYDRRPAKTAEAVKLSKENIPFIEAASDEEGSDKT